MDEKDALLALSGYSTDSVFLAVLDSAVAVQKQFPDSTLVDLFRNIWETEMPEAELMSIFNSAKLRNLLGDDSPNEEVYTELKNQFGLMRSRLLHVIKTRIEYLGITDAWVEHSANQAEANSGNISPDKVFVSLKNVEDPQTLEYALTTVGHFEMWETYNSNATATFGYTDDSESTLAALKQDTALQQVCVFNEKSLDLGAFALVKNEEAATEAFNKIMRANILPSDLRFMYGVPFSDGLTPVYTVKTTIGGESALDGSCIADANTKRYKVTENPYAHFYYMEGQADISVSDYNYTHKVILTFNPEGAKIFAQLTRDNADRFIAISIDKHIYRCAWINSEIEEGKLELIFTDLTKEEGESMAVILKSGSLSAKVRLEYK